MPVSRVERDFGGQEKRASPGGILRKVYFLLGGRGRTAIADIAAMTVTARTSIVLALRLLNSRREIRLRSDSLI